MTSLCDVTVRLSACSGLRVSGGPWLKSSARQWLHGCMLTGISMHAGSVHSFSEKGGKARIKIATSSMTLIGRLTLTPSLSSRVSTRVKHPGSRVQCSGSSQSSIPASGAREGCARGIQGRHLRKFSNKFWTLIPDSGQIRHSAMKNVVGQRFLNWFSLASAIEVRFAVHVPLPRFKTYQPFFVGIFKPV